MICFRDFKSLVKVLKKNFYDLINDLFFEIVSLLLLLDTALK